MAAAVLVALLVLSSILLSTYADAIMAMLTTVSSQAVEVHCYAAKAAVLWGKMETCKP
ncbi:unnamed protein product [Miscanthus lutarioriparius]|uniref:Uncharacterized protein n=1 Tax=Miscanthus lutarioriparius TaxID=422564 RepID=A0A811QGY8_9POAL|nr:unnamed protein product [Miscanthus lutarioriparius]